MILDKELQFSSEQAITVSAASENVVDLGPPGPNGYAVGVPDAEWYLSPEIIAAFTASGSATLALALQSSTDEAFSSPVTHWTLPAVGKADLVIGANPFEPMRIPYNVNRYIRLYYTVATGPMTAGKITVTGGAGPQTNT